MSLLFLCDLLDFIKRASYNLISDKIIGEKNERHVSSRKSKTGTD